MHAEAGEIVDEWIKRDEEDMEKILSKNGHKEKYWVVLFENVMPGKNIRFQGRTPIVRVLKDYDSQPRPLVGAHIAEVDNIAGKITWRSYPKDIPVDWSQITDQEMKSKQLIHECCIPSSYIYNRPTTA